MGHFLEREIGEVGDRSLFCRLRDVCGALFMRRSVTDALCLCPFRACVRPLVRENVRNKAKNAKSRFVAFE